jgi:capsular polysaccharide biosynthesis protein/Mrp family chromosome partitioning ATPase
LQFSGYLSVVRRWWWSLLLAAWLGGLVGYGIGSTLPPTYDATARVLVGPVSAPLDTLRASALLVTTYAELAASQPVIAAGAQQANVPVGAVAVTATGDETTRLITINVEYRTAAGASGVANAVAAQLLKLGSTSTERPESQLSLVEPAQPPADAAGPRVSLIAVLAAVVAASGALLIVLVLEFLDKRIREPRDLTDAGVAYLGTVSTKVPRLAGRGEPLVAVAAPASAAATTFRQLAGRLAASEEQRDVVAITPIESGGPAEEVAANLAVTLASAGRDVTILDANGIDPRLEDLFDIAPRPGLADVLHGTGGRITEARVRRFGLHVITYGTQNLAPLVEAKEARLIVDALRALKTFVIIVTAPPVDNPNAIVWVRAAGSSILAARQDLSRAQRLQAIVSTFTVGDIPLTGGVLVDTPLRRQKRSARATQAETARNAPKQIAQVGKRPRSRPH